MRVHWFGALQTESVVDLAPQGRDENLIRLCLSCAIAIRLRQVDLQHLA